ncbi:MAG: cytochrome c oxidase subunit 3, partial [Candidatus Omnitrophica bacterium]|nr:cytochrome c oxidase subunit 3 [Candidatus Omnitrophota bacterium]
MATATRETQTVEHHSDEANLQHHFDTPKQQFESGKLGMWIFLATEILFFGGLFVAYAVYRSHHPEIFLYAHQFLDKILGGVNTVVLICSSLTMAWAVRCAQLSRRTGLIVCLFLTLLCAFGFMGIKYVEYEQKWKHGLLWGERYKPQSHASHEETSRVEESPASAAADAPGEPAINPEERSAIPPAAVGPAGLS